MTALEWPPPGLTELHGRFRPLTRSATAATCIILAASMGFVAYVPDEFWFRDASAARLFVLWGGIGVAIMLAAAATAWRDIGRATLAVRRGYTWLTIAETMADHRGDGGALIGGTREFTSVTPQVRGAMRVARVISSIALLFAAALPIPVMVIMGWVGVDVTASHLMLLAIVLLPSAVLIVVSALATRIERFAFRESRLGHQDPLADRNAQKSVVEPWYETFDAARNGQSLGRGRSGGAAVGWALNRVACVALALIVASLIPLWIVSLTAPALFTWQGMRNYTSGTNRVRAFAPLRALVPAGDASMSPTQAGEAMHTLSMRGAAPQPAFVRRPALSLAAFPVVPESLIPNLRARSLYSLTSNIFPLARNGFDAKQRQFFTQLSASPGFDLVHVVARAPRADVAGGRYATPFDQTTSPFAIPQDPSLFTYDTLTWAMVGRAALLFADGKTAEAEAVFGELMGVGFRLADDGVSLNDESEGMYMVSLGRDMLRQMYNADPQLWPKRAWLDSVTRPPPQSPPGTPGAEAAAAQRAALSWTTGATRGKVINALTDSLLPRGRRFGLARAASLLVCTNMRELLFGPARDLRNALGAARKELVRTPAEGALFDLNSQAAERTYVAKRGPDGLSFDQVLFLRTAHAAGLVLRNGRIGNCAELAVGARQLGG